MEFILSPKLYKLQEVDISALKHSFVFKNREYSVLDYEIMGDHLALLVFRNQLKRAELILMTREGDTLAISTLPELPPASLFKDFLANVHYFSKANNAYQCYFDNDQKTFGFLYKTTIDSIKKLVSPFLFKISGRLYFQEELANGYGTAIGYCQAGRVKKYIWQYIDEKKIAENADDQKFYARWNDFSSTSTNPVLLTFSHGQFVDEFEQRAHGLLFYKISFPLVKTREGRLAVFNFACDRIEIMNQDGDSLRKVPITFHKGPGSGGLAESQQISNDGWRWKKTILVDDFSCNVYAVFQRNGMLRLEQIDLETGKIGSSTILPYQFPEKIEIYKGEAYFLVKGANENWKLAKCKL